jgi:NOL1/NOP2/sun family putative RNA methylase
MLPYNNLPRVAWCAEGRVYPDTERPAKNIFHYTGLFYIQEPSAMCPVEVLKPLPGHRVLDLCAAPGGKTAQIAGHMENAGLIVANDASPSRSRALVKNLERMGVTNAVVTTEQPKKLAGRFPEFFDRILVDAPCSGEGMFRRDPDAVKAYTANKPEACAATQAEILSFAAKMLKPGGRLVYSTCTFNTTENENVICDFLNVEKSFRLVSIEHEKLSVSKGFCGLPQTARIFPHLAAGEGHFVALLEKAGENFDEAGSEISEKTKHLHSFSDVQNNAGKNSEAALHDMKDIPKEFAEFCKEHMTKSFPAGVIVTHGASLYLQPQPLDLRGIRVARSGWYLGECAKGRFVPSHALAMGLRKNEVRYFAELSEENAWRYLRGESLDAREILNEAPPGKPWVMMCYENFPLGWTRLVQGRLKNNLPVGLVAR